MRHGLVAFVLAVAASLPAFSQPTAALHLIIVLDGLRPDSINARETPNLDRLP